MLAHLSGNSDRNYGMTTHLMMIIVVTSLAILDANEQAKVVLLDHIPHNDESNPDPDVRSLMNGF